MICPWNEQLLQRGKHRYEEYIEWNEVEANALRIITTYDASY